LGRFQFPASPFHKPPNELHSYDALAATGEPNRSYYEAMCETTDTEMGRLLKSIPADVRSKTMVIFIGDNGTLSDVKRGGLRGAKFGVYEGGIRAPLVVSGPLVVNPNRTVDQIVNSSDLFATIMDIHGIALSAVNQGRAQDTISFLPFIKNIPHPAPRETAFSDIRSSGAVNADFRRAVRNTRFKLLRFTLSGVTTEEYYDVELDPLEASNILQRTLTAT
jgi:arylsulfatase A-like enzyme